MVGLVCGVSLAVAVGSSPALGAADLGTKVSQDIAAAIAGRGTVDEALNKGQEQAEKVAADYK